MPKESWNKKHFTRLQYAMLADCFTKVWILCQVRMITVDLTLDCFAMRAQRIGIEIVKINAKQTDLLPNLSQLDSLYGLKS